MHNDIQLYYKKTWMWKEVVSDHTLRICGLGVVGYDRMDLEQLLEKTASEVAKLHKHMLLC